MSAELDDFDVADAVKNITDDIFSRPEPSPEVIEDPAAEGAPVVAGPDKPPPVSPATTKAPPVQPQPSGIVPGQNSVPKALPKAWKKDMAPHWESLTPEVKDYVYAREADVMRGIQEYQGRASLWDKLVQPFVPVLQQHPDVNPVQLMQGLMNTHLHFLDPSVAPEQKVAYAKRVLSEYGLTLDPSIGGAQPDPQIVQELLALRQEIGTLRSGYNQSQQQAWDAGVADRLREVNTFAADTKNEFFQEVGADIMRFLQTGAATTLADAYDLACYANPAVRARILAKQQVTAPAGNPRGPNGKFVNLDGQVTPPARVKKPGSIADTIDSIVASHYPAH